MQATGTRWLWGLSVLWGASIFWLAPHPPMIDLPQHAGQVALLKDLLLGQSPWAALFRINLFTPYLLGYGLALPLTFIMPVAAALKLLLSLAYLAFVAVCVKVRKHFGADPRLDWLFLPGFFGFAYHWGFFTFLLAAPIGLWFILLAARYSQHQTPARATDLGAAGLLLLASHGLVFLFALAVGMGTIALRWKQVKMRMLAAAPYAFLILACMAYFLINRHANAGMQTSITGITAWNGGLLRLPKAVIYTLTANISGHEFVLWGSAMTSLIIAPWLLGLRIDWRRTPSWIPFATLLCLFVLVPSYAAGTVFLYQRFGLFLLPAYAWMFPSHSANTVVKKLALFMLVAVCWGVLGVYSARAWQFREETADFDRLLSQLEPRQRALMLVFDPDSEATGSLRTYAHYPAWYQAEQQGLVDFNFAWFPPQIVRFRPTHLPAVMPGFEWHPERFDWSENQGSTYRYFFVRTAQPLSQDLFKGTDCRPRLLSTSGEWQVFEHRSCR